MISCPFCIFFVATSKVTLLSGMYFVFTVFNITGSFLFVVIALLIILF